MSAPFDQTFATSKHYFHHSVPNKPLCAVMHDKCVVRPERNQCYLILSGEAAGDKNLARQRLIVLNNDNAKMAGGRITQTGTNMHLIEGKEINEVIRHCASLFDEFKPRTWDQGQDEAQLEVVRDEYTDVLRNAIKGVEAAHKQLGLNRIEGESEIFASLPGLKLKYSGFPDFSQRVELKTKWSSVSDKTKSGKRATSLPSTPDWPHVWQVAGYWHGTGLPQTIVYANAREYRVFNSQNCERLTDESMAAALNMMIAKLAVRENLLQITKGKSIQDMLRLIEPDFSHHWAWDMHPALVEQAKHLWGVK